jgi:hypothetical protein
VQSGTVSSFLDTLLTTPSGTNVYAELQYITPAGSSVFWMTYWWELDSLSAPIQKSIMELASISPSGLKMLMTGEYETDSVTGLKLSSVIPMLKTVKSALGLKASPDSNVESAISTIRSMGGGRKGTRKQIKKAKRTRKH